MEAVLWSSKKQELVMLSTTKAKYVAATHAAKEALWIWCLLTELFASIDILTTLFMIASLPSRSGQPLPCTHETH